MIKENVNNYRMQWADALKLFTIFLVVWGHSISGYVIDNSFYGFDITLRKYLYSFHMPLFMVISGYFSYKIVDDGGNILKRFKTLIVPCITLAIIFLVLDINNQNMWYLKSLFICYTIICLFYRCFLSKRWIIIYIIIFSLIMFPIIVNIPYLSSYKIDFMLPFFLFGISLRRTFSCLIYGNYLLVYLFIFILCMLIWNKDFIWYNSPSQWFPLKWILMEKKIMFDWYNLYCVIMRFITGCFGSLFFISMFYKLSLTKLGDNIFSKFSKYGKYTLHIYILQTFLTQINIFNIVLPTNNLFVFQFVYTPIVSLIVTILCVFLAKVLEKNRYINRYLFGVF